MNLTSAFATAAILAATVVEAHPIQANKALSSEIVARSGLNMDEPAVQLTQRSTDINPIRLDSVKLPRDTSETRGAMQDEQIVKRHKYGELIEALDAMSTSDLYTPPSRAAVFFTKLDEPSENVKKILEDKFFYWEHSDKKKLAKQLREWEKEQNQSS